MNAEILAKVIRGETVESVHRGHLLIIDGEGNDVATIGDAETVAFIRSSAKAFQAIPFFDERRGRKVWVYRIGNCVGVCVAFGREDSYDDCGENVKESRFERKRFAMRNAPSV